MKNSDALWAMSVHARLVSYLRVGILQHLAKSVTCLKAPKRHYVKSAHPDSTVIGSLL